MTIDSPKGFLFKIIWPNDGWLTEYQISMRYNDAVANGDITEFTDLTSSFDQAEMLHAEGVITLHKDWKTICNECRDCGMARHNCLCSHEDL